MGLRSPRRLTAPHILPHIRWMADLQTTTTRLVRFAPRKSIALASPFCLQGQPPT
jgi:hypothetical protein